MKRRNPKWGCPRIAQQISLAFGIEIDKDVVRRVLSVHYWPQPESAGPSWLTFLGHTKDSLWSCDLFRCESATLRTCWVLVVMDQFTRRIIGFGVHSGIVDGVALCRMFQRAIRGHGLPKYLSTDHDPLYRFHQWQANLRVLEITEIKTVPYVPLSHPFVERLIGTIRREYLDRVLFWTTADLEMKLSDFQTFYNGHRTHGGLEGCLPEPTAEGSAPPIGLIRTSGGGTVEGCTKRQSRRDVINSPATASTPTSFSRPRFKRTIHLLIEADKSHATDTFVNNSK